MGSSRLECALPAVLAPWAAVTFALETHGPNGGGECTTLEDGAHWGSVACYVVLIITFLYLRWRLVGRTGLGEELPWDAPVSDCCGLTCCGAWVYGCCLTQQWIHLQDFQGSIRGLRDPRSRQLPGITTGVTGAEYTWSTGGERSPPTMTSPPAPEEPESESGNLSASAAFSRGSFTTSPAPSSSPRGAVSLERVDRRSVSSAPLQQQMSETAEVVVVVVDAWDHRSSGGVGVPEAQERGAAAEVVELEAPEQPDGRVIGRPVLRTAQWC